MPEFHNRENRCLKTEDGEIVWESRSCAVCVTTIWIPDGRFVRKPQDPTAKILMIKRSEKMEDEPGRYCLPCGYMDYNETAYEAATRELFEETGVDLDEQVLLFGLGLDQPWCVNSDPSSNRQNISLHFGFVFDHSEEVSFIPQESEVEKVDLVPIPELQDLDIAFNHEIIIKKFIEFYNDKRIVWDHEKKQLREGFLR